MSRNTLETLEGRTLYSATASIVTIDTTIFFPVVIPPLNPPTLSGSLLQVSGTSGNDTIGLSQSGNTLTVSRNGWNWNFDASTVSAFQAVGGAGNDSITVSDTVSKPTYLYGQDGNDTIRGGSGSDFISGGLGWDDVTYNQRSNGVNVSLDGVANDGRPAPVLILTQTALSSAKSSSLATVESSKTSSSIIFTPIFHGEEDNVWTDVEAVWGTQGNDTLIGSNADNYLFGEAGNDHIWGRGGNDFLFGWTGNDVMYGEDGNDNLKGEQGADYLSGGNGIDTADYSEKSANLYLTIDNLANDGQTGEGDNILTSVENINGGSGNDSIFGSAAANSLVGNGGNDFIFGFDGNDTLCGGNGNDYIGGGNGNDMIFGGTGNDTIYGDAGADYVWGESGNDCVCGGSDNDFLDGGTEADTVHGDSGNDSVYGSFGNDKVYGDSGDDLVCGGSDNDSVYGGDGNDRMYGDAGDDVLVAIGGGISDSLYGGTGNDSFWMDSTFLNLFEKAYDASAYETSTESVHFVGSFLNFKYTSGGSTFMTSISTNLYGQDIPDPTKLASGVTGFHDFSDHPLFGAGGPNENDIDQNAGGGTDPADCWYLASLSAAARNDSNFIKQHVVDLGDGTYSVWTKDGYTRVDADLPVNASGNPAEVGLGTGGAIWVALYEKVLACFRGGTLLPADYTRVGWGGPYEAADFMRATGKAYVSASTVPSATARMLWAAVQAESGRATVMCRSGHCWTVLGGSYNADGVLTGLRLRNPYGSYEVNTLATIDSTNAAFDSFHV